MITTTIIMSGQRVLNTAATRPHRAIAKKPMLDAAHSSYQANAVKAARGFVDQIGAAGDVLSQVTVSIPAHVGTPLVLSSKVVVDAMVAAGVVENDKCDRLQSLILMRHNPSQSPESWVWVDKTSDQKPSFVFPGIPAPPRYLPVNTEPKFKGAPSTPSAYRKVLMEEPWTIQGDLNLLNTLGSGCTLRIWINPIEPVDLDNVALRILDYLELKRGAEDSPLLIDEILGQVEVYFTDTCTSDTVMFELYAPQYL